MGAEWYHPKIWDPKPWNLWMLLYMVKFLQMWLNILRGTGYSGFSGWALDATIGTLVREGQRDNSHTEAEIGGMWPKSGEKKKKKFQYPSEAGRGKGRIRPLSLQKRHNSNNTLMLAHWNWLWNSGLHNYERINFSFFQATMFVLMCYSHHLNYLI